MSLVINRELKLSGATEARQLDCQCWVTGEPSASTPGPQVTQELTHSGFACEGLCDEFRGLPLGVPQATFSDHSVLKKMLDDIRVRTFNEVPTSREGETSLLASTIFPEHSATVTQ